VTAKIAGEEIVAPAVETPSRVVNLMDALRRSVEGTGAKSKTAKAPAKKAEAAARPKRRAKA
jgi:non-homologous end joining protein Ku